MDSEYLLRLACWGRTEFYKLWNQLQQSDDSFLPLEEKLSLIFKVMEERPLPLQKRLPTSIRFISMLDVDYPASLLELPQPPLGLFVEGVFGDSTRAGVVGSRKPLPYSRRLTREVVGYWARRGHSIISGGAIGIDGEAHTACLEANGHTLVVLGGGILKPHPRSHVNLFREVIRRGGALVSEYPPDFEPRPYTFPERNRIIAALSDLLFLAQAHEKSGSLSTARTALDLGRDIYVLRPVSGDPNFAGSQALIDSGAKILIDPRELAGDLSGIHLERKA